MNTMRHHTTQAGGQFSREVSGLPASGQTERVALADGGHFDLRISPVAKRIGDAVVRMLAYNGSIPGPTLVAKQGSEVTVNVVNEGDVEATVHWHGIRLENRYDGVPYDTQEPIPVGGSFSYRVRFADEGLYWYHPHLREDYTQDMGLYGNILVEPAQPGYWPPADREVMLTVDDVLLEDGKLAAYDRAGPNYIAMGRFGNVLLVNGEPDWSFETASGEVTRFWLTNTANTRVFNLRIPGARMKLAGGDSGRYENETFVDEVLLGPSERAVVDVFFDRIGDFLLEHRTPRRSYRLGRITVRGRTSSSSAESFPLLRSSPELQFERRRIAPDLEREPDKVLALIAEMHMEGDEGAQPQTYSCPMHPEIVSDEPGRCPKCGMKLLPAPTAASSASSASAEPVSHEAPRAQINTAEHEDHVPTGAEHGAMGAEHGAMGAEHGAMGANHGDTRNPGEDGAMRHPGEDAAMRHAGEDASTRHAGEHGGGQGHAAGSIEWEDTMVEMNRMSKPANMRWSLVDRETGKQNAEIDWSFSVGDRVKIRLVNEMDSDHPMHHPFHIHGAGRFLVLSRDGVAEPNLVWKDTVLIKTGEVVDILLDATNPGRWMAHCHIAEHAESGMMFTFEVEDRLAS